jgi:hypothetical protein
MISGSEEKLLKLIKRIDVQITQRDISCITNNPRSTLQAVMNG